MLKGLHQLRGVAGLAAKRQGGVSGAATAPGTMSAPTLTQIDRTSLLVARGSAPSNGGSPITSYDLRYSTDQATWTTVTGITASQTQTGLTAGTVYYIQTRAVNAIGAGPWSASKALDTVFDYSLYNEAGSATISAADLAGLRIFSGGSWQSPSALGLTVAQDITGELLISGFASSAAASAAAAAGIHFEQQIAGEPYSAVDTVATANTTGTSIKGLHYLETGRTLNNAPQPGLPLVPTRELSPVTG